MHHFELSSAPTFWHNLLTAVLTSPWLLILVIALSFFWQLGAVPLYDLDEGAFTEATREMLNTGNFITPHRDGAPRYDKPVLIYWLQAASTQIFGFNEFALRLPSALAASLWVLALWGFVRQRIDAPTATVAGLTLALALQVSLIAKAAVADALLNLLIALTFFEIYRYFLEPDAPANRRYLLRAYLWMALGFLTKGPVAVFFPLVVSLLFALSTLRWQLLWHWLKAIFNPLGWLIFLLVASPWYFAIYLNDGTEFFRSFFLHHNLGRFDTPIHNHSGFFGYYFIMLPLMLLPFSGWFINLFRTLNTAWSNPLERFLWLWFITVFAFFSVSATQLPHYLLYGAVPLFILMAKHRAILTNRWLALTPPLALFVFLVALPLLLDVAIHIAHGIATSPSAEVRELLTLQPHTAALLGASRQVLDLDYGIAVLAGLLLTVVLLRWSTPPLWQRLIFAGLVQTVVVYGFVVPRVFEVLQAPVKEAALIAKQLDLPTISYRTSLPSFSVYRDAITPQRSPRAGDLVFLRVDKLPLLTRDHPDLQQEMVYQHGAVALVRLR
ncbi:glycoside hydrolase [Chromatium weissei]|nr:glycoside hydrolase [Chromatium weissei]